MTDLTDAAQALADRLETAPWYVRDYSAAQAEDVRAALTAEATAQAEYRPGDVGAAMELGKRISDHLAAGGGTPPEPTDAVRALFDAVQETVEQIAPSSGADPTPLSEGDAATLILWTYQVLRDDVVADSGRTPDEPGDDPIELRRRAEVAESIYQRHADGWRAVVHEIVEPPCWNRSNPDDTEPMTADQVAWLKGQLLPAGVETRAPAAVQP